VSVLRQLKPSCHGLIVAVSGRGHWMDDRSAETIFTTSQRGVLRNTVSV
jgi:hypothetical protein